MPPHHTAPLVFSLQVGRSFASRICAHLQVPLGAHEERDFEDGEHKTRALESVRESDVYVVQSLQGGDGYSTNDLLIRVSFFLGSLRDAGARHVTLVAPYLCYQRKDRRTKARDPVSSRYVACLLEAMGIDRVVSIDVHNPVAYQNAFRIPAEHLTASRLLAGSLKPNLTGQEVTVVSPDAGGSKRAEAFRHMLESCLEKPVALAFVEKFRSEGVLRGGLVVGDVKGRSVVLVDDLVSSGETLARAAQACRGAGARTVYAAVTHGLFSGGASDVLRRAELERLVITDTVAPERRLDEDLLHRRVSVIDSAPLFADAIRRLHSGSSLIDLTDVS